MSRKQQPDKPKQKEFVDLLDDFFAHTGMTRFQLAQTIAMSKQYLNDIEKGRKLPSVNFVRALTRSGLVKNTRQFHVTAARAHGWEV